MLIAIILKHLLLLAPDARFASFVVLECIDNLFAFMSMTSSTQVLVLLLLLLDGIRLYNRRVSQFSSHDVTTLSA